MQGGSSCSTVCSTRAAPCSLQLQSISVSLFLSSHNQTSILIRTFCSCPIENLTIRLVTSPRGKSLKPTPRCCCPATRASRAISHAGFQCNNEHNCNPTPLCCTFRGRIRLADWNAHRFMHCQPPRLPTRAPLDTSHRPMPLVCKAPERRPQDRFVAGG